MNDDISIVIGVVFIALGLYLVSGPILCGSWLIFVGLFICVVTASAHKKVK